MQAYFLGKTASDAPAFTLLRSPQSVRLAAFFIVRLVLPPQPSALRASMKPDRRDA